MRVPSLFRALNSRNYRIYFFGQTFSLIGTWMQQVAIGWLVYRLTNSAFLLGLVGFASQVPALFLVPLTGSAADHYSRRSIMLGTQLLFMAQALILALVVFLGIVNIYWILALSLAQGIIMAFDAPARHSLVVQMVDRKEDLANGIALNSALFHASRFVGPAAAGILVALYGEGVCFLINGLTYTTIIAALFVLQVNFTPVSKREGSVMHDFADGVRYARSSLPIRSILLLVAFISLFGMPYTTMLPIVARDILHGNSTTYGYLMSGAGTGAVAGALYLASRKSTAGLLRNVAGAPLVFGVAVVALAFSRTLPLSLFVLAVAAFGMMTIMATSNTILQSIVDEAMRGRIMSLYTLSFLGTVPFGHLFAGTLAAHLGAPTTLCLMGGMCILSALVFNSYTEKIDAAMANVER